MAAAKRAQILAVGHDQRVLDTQSAVLQSAGWDVVSTMDDVEAISLAASANADLAVLGDSIDPSERVFLGQTLKRMNPAIAVVMLDHEEAGTFPQDAADAVLQSLSGPQILIDTIRGLLKQKARHQIAS